MNKLFLDTDTILDLLLARAPHYAASAGLFTTMESKRVHGYVSALTFANLHYILRRSLSSRETLRHLHKLRLLLHIAPLTDKIVDQALSSEFDDFEDALQYYTALEHGMDCLITRNKRDYKQARLPLYTAQEYLSSIQA